MNTQLYIILATMSIPFVALGLLVFKSLTKDYYEFDDQMPGEFIDKIGIELNNQVSNSSDFNRTTEPYIVDTSLKHDPLIIFVDYNTDGYLIVTRVLATDESGKSRDITDVLADKLDKYVCEL